MFEVGEKIVSKIDLYVQNKHFHPGTIVYVREVLSPIFIKVEFPNGKQKKFYRTYFKKFPKPKYNKHKLTRIFA